MRKGGWLCIGWFHPGGSGLSGSCIEVGDSHQVQTTTLQVELPRTEPTTLYYLTRVQTAPDRLINFILPSRFLRRKKCKVNVVV